VRLGHGIAIVAVLVREVHAPVMAAYPL
jgi:hypothetical protein